MTRIRIFILAAFALASIPASAETMTVRSTPPMKDAELAAIRAGYISADGVTFSFGVSLQTFVGGQLALASTLNVDAPGGANLSTNSPAGLSGAPSGLKGTSLTLAGGATTLIQQFTPTSVQNIVATSASNQTIAQNVNVSLALAGFQQNQAAYQLRSTVSSVSSQLLAGFLTRR